MLKSLLFAIIGVGILKYFSQKKLWLILLVVLAVGGIFMLLGSQKSFNSILNFERSAESAAEKAFEAIVGKDSDKDGLKDWEETLWKTDPKNPDSDGDGTKDGEEVKNDRDPTKPAPGDELKSSDTQDSIGDGNEDGTLTSAVIEQALTMYTLTQQTGGVNDRIKQQVNEVLLDEAKKKGAFAGKPIYLQKDLKIVDNTTENFNEYITELLVVLKIHAGAAKLGVVSTINTAVETGDESVLETLDGAVDFYKNLAKKILEIKTPSSLSGLHLELANNYNSVAMSISSMKLLIKDPVAGLAGVVQYSEYTQEIIKIVEEISSIVSEKIGT